MNVTEVRIKLAPKNAGSRLLAYASITFDDVFVVRDLKLIEGGQGLLVAMPSRRLAERCPQCGTKNITLARFCNACGDRLSPSRAKLDDKGNPKLYSDVAHPVSSAFRFVVEDAVIDAYHREVLSARQPGYICAYDRPA